MDWVCRDCSEACGLVKTGDKMDLNSRATYQMAREMGQRIDELESAISVMRTLRDEMEELYSELFGVSWQKKE